MTVPIVTNDARRPTDISAHNARIDTYGRLASKDINDVLNDELAAFPRESSLTALDLGCGNGKQTKRLVELFPNCKVLAIDASEEAIEELKSIGISNVKAEVADFNKEKELFSEIENFAAGCGFDIIISFYAIYYAPNSKELIRKLLSLLKPAGQMILVGYSQFNNKELLEISGKYSNEKYDTADFLTSSERAELFHDFPVSYWYFVNPIQFPDEESFLNYYRNYGLYSKDLEPKVVHEVNEKIRISGAFTLSKVSLVVSVSGAEEKERAFHLPSDLNSDQFSPKKYRDLLNAILGKAFRIHRIQDLKSAEVLNAEKIMLLRHDIDLCPYYALKMAEEESKLGVVSTYYFLISGGYYNILEKENREILYKIRDMGHEIGLHWDNEDTLQEDLSILGDLVGESVKSISQHNPTIDGIKKIEELHLVNAYSSDITEKHGFTYISDSGMKWRQRTIFDCLDDSRIYFLAHPESWWSDGNDLVQLIRMVQQREGNKLRKQFDSFVAGNIDYLYARKSLEQH